ncbi:hypothetical protein [Agromyces albus]|uniref:hypothetical protein n=1 Tax=Agromyces albus TaxID=205332 RepID=UPI0027891575|nr:hypothetical protein [Agromyces albus]MDQ0575936.1 hypothetical protein [Agromyces albus]
MSEIRNESGSSAQRLQALGLDLPAVRESPKFENQRAVDSSVHVAGQLPFMDGELQGQGASERLVDVLGENGRHPRTAIGVAGLPLNSPVEIQMICTAM